MTSRTFANVFIDAPDNAAPIVIGQSYPANQTAIVTIPNTAGPWLDVKGNEYPQNSIQAVKHPTGGVIAAADPITVAEFALVEAVQGANTQVADNISTKRQQFITANNEEVSFGPFTVWMNGPQQQAYFRSSSGTIAITNVRGRFVYSASTGAAGWGTTATLNLNDTTNIQTLSRQNVTGATHTSYNFINVGDTEVFEGTVDGVDYRITSVVGPSYNNNIITFEQFSNNRINYVLASEVGTATIVLYNQANVGGVGTTVGTLADIGFALQPGDQIFLQTDIGLASAVWTGNATVTSTRFQQGGGASENTIRFSQTGTVLQFQGNNVNGTRQWLKIVR